MRVAFVTHLPLQAGSPAGGVEAVSVNLLEALSGFADLEMHALTLDAGRTAPEVSSWGKVTVHRLPRPQGSTLGVALWSGRRAVSEYLLRLAPDLVHAHDTYGLMVRGLPLPRLFTVHGFIYGDTLVSGRKLPRLRSALWRFFEFRGWADQTDIVSISPYVKERLRGRTRARVHEIENPIAPEFFAVARRERKGVVLCSAVISPRKNTLALVEAAAELRRRGVEFELRLAGAVVDEGYGTRVQEAVRQGGLEGRVVMLGRIDRGAVLEELAQASVYALVSLEENAPLGVQEAMAAGVPVVTSNRCGMPFQVSHGEHGFLVEPEDVADIARRLGELLSDDALRARMGRSAALAAEQRFHPLRVARRTRDVYYGILGRRVPGENE